MDSIEAKRITRHGKRHTWTPFEITEEEIAVDWRKIQTRQFKTKRSTVYYCVDGFYDCPMRILRNEYNNGKVDLLTNGLPHRNHNRTKCGLTKEQKELVMNAPVRKPNDLMKLFKLQNVEVPDKRKLKSFLQRFRRGFKPRNPKIKKAEKEGSVEQPSSRSPQELHDDDSDNHFDDEPMTRSRSPSPVSKPKPITSQTLRSGHKKTAKTPTISSRKAKSSVRFSGKLVSLKWDDQLEQLQEALKRMYEDANNGQVLTDVTLISSDEQVVEAHQFVLSMCSPYFQRLFTKVQGSKKAVGNTVIILDAQISHLQSLLQFVYTGQMNVASGDVEEIRKLGDLLEIPGLMSSVKKGVNSEGYVESEGYHDNVKQSRERDNDSVSSSSYQLRTRIRATKRKSYREEEDDTDSQDESEDDTTTEYFDDFHTTVSEDEQDVTSEPEMKVEVERAQSPAVEGEGDSDGGGKTTNSNVEAGDKGFTGRQEENLDENSSLKRIKVIALKVQKPSTESKEQLEKEKPKSEPMVNPRTGVLETEEDRKRKFKAWTEIESLPIKELRENWAILTKRVRKNESVTPTCCDLYYCRHGSIHSRCPVELKVETFCGRKIWYTNGLEHANHRDIPHGLTNEQKGLIDVLVSRNIRTPLEIQKAMESQSEEIGIRVPTERQIKNYMMNQRKKTVRRLEILTGQKLRRKIRGRPKKEGSLAAISKPTTRNGKRQLRNYSTPGSVAASHIQTQNQSLTSSSSSSNMNTVASPWGSIIQAVPISIPSDSHMLPLQLQTSPGIITDTSGYSEACQPSTLP